MDVTAGAGRVRTRQLKSVRVTFSAAKRLPFIVEIHSCVNGNLEMTVGGMFVCPLAAGD